MSLFLAFFSPLKLCVVLAEAMVISAEVTGVHLNSNQTGQTPPSLQLRRPAHNKQQILVVDRNRTFEREATKAKPENVAFTQRMLSKNFVDKDWSTGFVWGILLGWIAAVVWAAPAVFAAATRSPSNIGANTPVWQIHQAASCMSGWGAFCATFWMSQWFISMPYCFLASSISFIVAFVVGNLVVSKWHKDLSSAVMWAIVGTCSVIMTVMVIWVISHNQQSAAPEVRPSS